MPGERLTTTLDNSVSGVKPPKGTRRLYSSGESRHSKRKERQTQKDSPLDGDNTRYSSHTSTRSSPRRETKPVAIAQIGWHVEWLKNMKTFLTPTRSGCVRIELRPPTLRQILKSRFESSRNYLSALTSVSERAVVFFWKKNLKSIVSSGNNVPEIILIIKLTEQKQSELDQQ